MANDVRAKHIPVDGCNCLGADAPKARAQRGFHHEKDCPMFENRLPAADRPYSLTTLTLSGDHIGIGQADEDADRFQLSLNGRTVAVLSRSDLHSLAADAQAILDDTGRERIAKG